MFYLAINTFPNCHHAPHLLQGTGFSGTDNENGAADAVITSDSMVEGDARDDWLLPTE